MDGKSDQNLKDEPGLIKKSDQSITETSSVINRGLDLAKTVSDQNNEEDSWHEIPNHKLREEDLPPKNAKWGVL